MNPVTVDLICVVYNHPKSIIKRMIDSAVRCLIYCPYFIYKIHIVNNGTVYLDESEFQEHVPNPAMLSIYNHMKNIGYCGGNNLGIRNSEFEYIIIVNPDIIFHESLCFDWLIGSAIHYKSIVGKLVGTNRWYTYPATFPTDKKYKPEELPFYSNEPTHTKPGNWKPFKYIDGSLMAFPRQLFDKVGGFDESMFPGYFGENTFAFKAFLHGYTIKDAFIDKLYSHDQNHTDEENKLIVKWTKAARELFYKNYALSNWGKFLTYLE